MLVWLQNRKGALAILLSSMLALVAVSCASRDDSPADRLLSSHRILTTLPESTAAFYLLNLSDEGFKKFRQSEWGQAVGKAISGVTRPELDTVISKLSTLLVFAWVDQGSADIGLGSVAEMDGSIVGSDKGAVLEMLKGLSLGVSNRDLQFEQSDGRSLLRLMLREGAGPEVWIGAGDSRLVATTAKEKTIELLDRMDGRVKGNATAGHKVFMPALDRALEQGALSSEQFAIPGFAFFDLSPLLKAMMSGNHPIDDSLLENPFVAPFESFLIRHSGDPRELKLDLLAAKKAGSSRNDALFDAFKGCLLPHSAATLPNSMNFSLALPRSVLMPLIENVQTAREALGIRMDLDWLRPAHGLTLGSRVISDESNGLEYIAEVDADDPTLLLRGIKERTRRFTETPPATPIDWNDRMLDDISVSEMRMPFGGGFFSAITEHNVLVFASSEKAMQSTVSKLREAKKEGARQGGQDTRADCIKGMVDLVALGRRTAATLHILAQVKTAADGSTQRSEISSLIDSLATQRTFGVFEFAAGAIPRATRGAIAVRVTLTPPLNH